MGLEGWGTTVTQEWPEDAQPGTPLTLHVHLNGTLCPQCVGKSLGSSSHPGPWGRKKSRFKDVGGGRVAGRGQEGSPELLTFCIWSWRRLGRWAPLVETPGWVHRPARMRRPHRTLPKQGKDFGGAQHSRF